MTERKASPSDICDLSTPVALSSSDDLRLFTLAALGFTYSQMEMLAKNHIEKGEPTPPKLKGFAHDG